MTTLDPLAVANGGAPFSAPATAEEAREYIRAHGIEFLFAQFVDMHGKPNAKLVPASHFDDLLSDGAGFAGFAAGDIGQSPNSPDMAAMPDVRTLTQLPWKPEVALRKQQQEQADTYLQDAHPEVHPVLQCQVANGKRSGIR